MSNKYEPYDITGEIPDDKSENPTTKAFTSNWDFLKNTIGLNSDRLKKIKDDNSKSYDPDRFNKLDSSNTQEIEDVEPNKNISKEAQFRVNNSKSKPTFWKHLDNKYHVNDYIKPVGLTGAGITTVGLGLLTNRKIQKDRKQKQKQL